MNKNKLGSFLRIVLSLILLFLSLFICYRLYDTFTSLMRNNWYILILAISSIIILFTLSALFFWWNKRSIAIVKIGSIMLGVFFCLFGIHYLLTNKFSEKMLNQSEKTLKTADGVVAIKSNYRSEVFDRTILPTCGTCGKICFEQIKFQNNGTVIVLHNLYDAQNFYVYEKMLNLPDTLIKEIYTINNDSLLSKNYFMLWSFKNDTLELSEITSKKFEKVF